MVSLRNLKMSYIFSIFNNNNNAIINRKYFNVSYYVGTYAKSKKEFNSLSRRESIEYIFEHTYLNDKYENFTYNCCLINRRTGVRKDEYKRCKFCNIYYNEGQCFINESRVIVCKKCHKAQIVDILLTRYDAEQKEIPEDHSIDSYLISLLDTILYQISPLKHDDGDTEVHINITPNGYIEKTFEEYKLQDIRMP